MPVENIILEFSADVSKLAPAEQRLEKLGAIDKQQGASFKNTNAELSKRAALTQRVDTGTAAAVKSVEKLSNAIKTEGNVTKISAAEFKKMGLTLEEFIAKEKAAAGATAQNTEEQKKGAKAGKDAATATVSLRQELKNLTQQLAALKLAGKDNTEQYKQMVIQAGNIKDAIGDAAAEIKDAGSDTKTFDNLLGSAQALAGGFAVAQGAAALFGGESEELQETLLKVNAAMAVLQGLQAIQNALQKEGAITLAIANVQQSVRNAGIAIENGLQSTSVVVRGAATAAQWALNAAMSANPIGVVIVALTGLILLLNRFATSSKAAAKAQAELNSGLSRANAQLDAYIEGVENANKRTAILLEERGAKNSEVLKGELNTTKLIGAAKLAAIEDLNRLIIKNQNSTNKKDIELVKELGEKKLELEKDVSDLRIKVVEDESKLRIQLSKEALEAQVSFAEAALANAVKNSGAEFEARRRLSRAQSNLEIKEAGENAAKIAEIRAKLNQTLRQIDQDAAKARFEDRKAFLENELLAAQRQSKAINERNSQSEVDAQKQLILEQARFDVKQEGLTWNEKILIFNRAHAEMAKLQKDFNKQSARETLEDQISRNNAELTSIRLTQAEKQDIIEENILTAAQIELDANVGNAAKILEITKKRDEAIRDSKKKFLDEALEYELSLEAKRDGANRRRLERTVNNEKKNFEERKNAQRQITDIELEENGKRINNLNDEYDQKLISQEEYNLKYAELVDNRNKIQEDGDRKLLELSEAQFKRLTDNTLAVAEKLVGLLSNIYSQQSEEQLQAISEQKQAVDDLLAVGAITEKEAEKRRRKLETQEKIAKQRQAEREKQIALFEALLAIPRAFLQGLQQGGPILGAIYAAIAGVQAGLIASRKPPKFGKGKKDRYEGWGEVAETGTEIIEKKGKMYVQKDRGLVWLNADDKVYNPAETRKILEGAKMSVDKTVISVTETGRPSGSGAAPIDYDKLAHAIARKTPPVNLNIDGFKDFLVSRNKFETYLNNRRSYRK